MFFGEKKKHFYHQSINNNNCKKKKLKKTSRNIRKMNNIFKGNNLDIKKQYMFIQVILINLLNYCNYFQN